MISSSSLADNRIKVGFVVGYDWKYLKRSLPLIHEGADRITLAVDRDRRTWAGNRYELGEDFYDWVNSVNKEAKITIYEDSFYAAGLTPQQNDGRHRAMLTDAMGKGGWHIQIDSDEYFIDFTGFTEYLKKRSHRRALAKRNVGVHCTFITLFKKVNGGYLYIDQGNNYQQVLMATRFPDYSKGRGSPFDYPEYSPYIVIHDSWARPDGELFFKLNNWTHNKDFDTKSYFELWKAIDEKNYRHVANFHPFAPNHWLSLRYIPCKDMESLIRELSSKTWPRAGKSGFFWSKVSRWLAGKR